MQRRRRRKLVLSRPLRKCWMLSEHDCVIGEQRQRNRGANAACKGQPCWEIPPPQPERQPSHAQKQINDRQIERDSQPDDDPANRRQRCLRQRAVAINDFDQQHQSGQ